MPRIIMVVMLLHAWEEEEEEEQEEEEEEEEEEEGAWSVLMATTVSRAVNATPPLDGATDLARRRERCGVRVRKFF